MSQPEARLQARIVRELRRAGFPAWRIRPAGLVAWPDLYVILPGGRACHLEIKMPGKRPTVAQLSRLDELEQAGAVTGWATSVEAAVGLAAAAARPGRGATTTAW